MFSRSEESGSVLEAPEVSQQQKPQQHLIGGMKAESHKYRRKKIPETSVKRADAKKNTGAGARACLCRC